jgi:pimeloyl-ACP methyl ester carboxylesterase
MWLLLARRVPAAAASIGAMPAAARPVELVTRAWTPRGPASSETPHVVLVHGVTGWHRTWWRVGPALAAAGWRAVAIDLRGHGHSPRIEGSASVADFAADVRAVIERIGRPVALVGHSLGAAVGAELCFTRPELVTRAVLEDPPAVTRVDDTEWQANLEREMRAARETPAAEMARERAENPGWQVEDVRQNVEGRALADADGILASFRRETGARVLPLVPRQTVPISYLLATEERSVFRGDARHRLQATLPTNAAVEVIDAGHTIHRDAYDAYLAHVLRWLEPAR